MNEKSLRNVQARAVAGLREGAEFAFATDASADPVLVAIARPEHSFVLTIARAEYGMGIELGNLLGFPNAKPAPAIDRLRRNNATT